MEGRVGGEIEGEFLDEALPFIVAIGASAGGLEAIEALLDHVPAGTGAAFVVVQHLSPDFKSLMDQLLAKHTSLTIRQARDGLRIEPEHLYLIPARKDMRLRGDRLVLTDRSMDRTLPVPIDIFFESVAEEAGSRAIAVVLSGTGSDGTRGVGIVKAKGGFVLVQSPTSSKFDGMPRSAIATGLADLVAEPEELARVLSRYLENPGRGLVPNEPDHMAEPLSEIFERILHAKGIDFALYKDRTILRRIERRMGLLQLKDIRYYRDLVIKSDDELERLVQDLLIGVTEFYRDDGTFERLERELPSMVDFAGGGHFRAWVAGCSTGEEAYSIAMLLEEQRRRTGAPHDFKVFASDVNEQAIQRAGAGLFPAGTRQRVPPHLLERYFEQTSSGYVIRRSIRDRVVFAQHNLVADPPFTRMHLVACRNLLIYMKAEVQQRILGNLHFALAPRGFMLLGPSETTGELAAEFDEVDPKHRLYRKRRNVRLAVAGGLPALTPRMTVPVPSAERRTSALLNFDRVCSSFLSEFVPTCLLLDEDGTIRHSFGKLEEILVIPTGRATLNALKMVSAPVRAAISTAMHRSRRIGQGVTYESVALDEEATRRANITVRWLPPEEDGEGAIFLVIVGDPHALPEGHSVGLEPASEAAGHIDRLENELQYTKENLQTTIEELETANEELQSTNEELLSANEELQSTNEELHSVNEELYTVNAEHQKKIEELTELSADIENLLRTTEVGTVFLDAELCIRKFTPHAAEVIHLVDSDVGRPIGHLSSVLPGVDLEGLAREAISCERRAQQHARDRNGVSRLVRVFPYKQYEQVVGAVITVVDTSAVVEAEQALAESERRFKLLVENLDQVFWWKSPDGQQVHYASPYFERLWGFDPERLEAEPELWERGIHPEDRAAVRNAYYEQVKEGAYDIEYRVVGGPLGERAVHAKGFAITSDEGEVLGIAGFTRDITVERERAARLEELATRLESQAQTDALTGLANRRGLEVMLSRELSRASRTGQSVAAVLVDVDDFKRINDSLGHSTGDVVLQGIAKRLVSVLRPSDLSSRIGGDEFLVVLPETRLAEAIQVSERLRLAVRDEPMSFGGQSVEVSASFGVAIVPLEMVSIEQILDSTRTALGASKRQGKNRVIAATDGQGQRCSAVATHDEVVKLTQDDSMTALVQSIRDVVSGEVVGYEMLSRGPDGPYRQPSDFFRLGQEQNILSLLDLRCLQCCVEASGHLNPEMRVHLNLFPSTLVDSPVQRIVELLETVSSPDRFCIEISEQQFLGAPAYLTESVRELRAKGVQIAVDDVGFGRSSIEALVTLEPDVIKIAREFVMHSDSDQARRRGLERLTRASRALSTELVAEGVETEGERSVLIDLGIHRGQGFLWDRPRVVTGVAGA